MSTVDDEVVNSTAVELEPTEAVVEAQVEAPEEQRQTAVYRHPDRESIHTLMRVGKTARWINRWLADRYPLLDADQDDHENAAQHKRWHITEKTLDGYRERWLPEAKPGLDVVSEELEDIIGRRMPQAAGDAWEVEMLEAAVRVAEANLARSLTADQNLGMLTPTTLDANDKLISAAQASLSAKSRLGRRGYEAAPERHDLNVKGEHRHLNAHLHGELNPRTGQREAVNKPAVELLSKMLELPEGERRKLMETADATAAENVMEMDGDEPAGD